jgi:hypothetical protein
LRIKRLRSYVAFSLPSKLFLYKYSFLSRALRRIMLFHAQLEDAAVAAAAAAAAAAVRGGWQLREQGPKNHPVRCFVGDNNHWMMPEKVAGDGVVLQTVFE